MFPFESDFESKVSLESAKIGVIDEPPFHILMLGDWGGDADKIDLPRRRPLEIDRDNFDDIMKRLRVRLDLGDLTLDFQSLDDFHPDELFQQVPMFAELRDLRRRLLDADTFNSAAREVRDWFPAPEEPVELVSDANQPQSVEPPAGNLLDSILSRPDAGATSPQPQATASRELSNLISDFVRPHLVSVDENEQANLLAAVDSATSNLMRNIMHNRRFQALESAWRGLYFLVRRTETASDLKIFILDVSKDEVAEDLKSAANLNDSMLYEALVTDADDEPWAAVFGNYAFLPNIDDTATLIRLGKLAAGADAPFVSHMRCEILGISSLADHPDPSDWNRSDDSNEAKLWTALRDQVESAYLGMTIPRFLARLPYGRDTDPVETFSFEEFTGEPVHDDYLWANSSFVVALLLAQSYSSYGWEMGRVLLQDVDGLPTHIYTKNGEAITTPCAEVQLTQNACERLMDFGLMPLVSFKNSDRIRLARFQSITDPVTALKSRWT